MESQHMMWICHWHSGALGIPINTNIHWKITECCGFLLCTLFFGPRPTRGFSFCLDLSTYGGDLTTNHGIELIKATILYLGDLTKRTWWDMICEVADFTNILFLTSVLSRQQRVDKDLSTPTKVRQGFIRPWSEMVPECPWMLFILMLASFSFIFPILQFVGLKPTRGYQ